MAKKLAISLKPGHAMQVTRILIRKKRLVYVILVPKALKYQFGRSKIAYIGTTKKGGARIAQSVAAHADDILSRYGVREFTVRIVTCPRRQGVNTWPKLERALLLAFRQKHGVLPKCNKQGKHIKEQDVFKYFNRDRLVEVLRSLNNGSKPSVKRLPQRRKVRNKTVKQNH